MSYLPVCSSPSQERPGDSLAAPVEAGQGVGTSCAMQDVPASEQIFRRNRETVAVLESMLLAQAGGSPEYFALLRAIVIFEQQA